MSNESKEQVEQTTLQETENAVAIKIKDELNQLRESNGKSRAT